MQSSTLPQVLARSRSRRARPTSRSYRSGGPSRGSDRRRRTASISAFGSRGESRADACNRRESQRRCKSRLDSGRLSRSIPKCWVGCNRPTMKTADQADLADDFLDLSEPRFCGANLGPLLPVPPLRDGPKRGLEFSNPILDPSRKVGGDLPLRHEVAEQLSRLLEVLRRFVPETPVVREEIGDMVGVDRLPIPVGRGFHVVPEEQHDEVHEILPTDLVDLQLLEDHVRERNRGGVELEPPTPRFLSEENVVAELELVEEDVDVEPIFALVVDEPSVAEETVDHVVRPESEVVEHPADRSALTRVPHQVEVCKQGRALADAPHAVEDRNAFGHVHRMRVNPKGP